MHANSIKTLKQINGAYFNYVLYLYNAVFNSKSFPDKI